MALVTTGATPGQFGQYYPEVMRAEGLNDFSTLDASQLNAATLTNYSVVVLAQMALTDVQVATLTAWVQGGGNLVAMRPDPKLAGLLGLTAPAGTLANAYLTVDTRTAPGAGITGAPMQFHGGADRYGLAGAQAVATLYTSATTPTTNPAVTIRTVGAGRAAAFTYDLARSVVYTRQGNPDWAGTERDGQSAIRSDDLFFGGAAADWVDLSGVAVPQADEQQRLLANVVTQMSAARMPLPRFWYFPRGERAVVVMTGDDHSDVPTNPGATASHFQDFIAKDPPGCSVPDWQCVRATSYVYPTAGPLDAGQFATYQAMGFEIALHLHVPGSTDCANFPSLSALNSALTTQIGQFVSRWGADPPATIRTHCVIWSDWASQPEADLAHGIRLNTDYYYWPASWVQERPGMFTGSGIPMRFADLDGTPIDVYQATTQITDETTSNAAAHIAALLDGALGTQGFYGAFTVNMHNDQNSGNAGAMAIVAAAQQRDVPVVSAQQLLDWLDGRDASSFQSLRFDATGRETFTIAPGAGARGLEAMQPIVGGGGSLISLTRDGQPVATTRRTVKGVDYAVFPAVAGNYVATYPPPAPSPAGSASGPRDEPTVATPRRGSLAVLVSRLKHAPTFPRLRRSATRFRPGSGRTFSLYFRLPRTARVTWTVRTANGKLVARVRTSNAFRQGTILRLRWDGRKNTARFVGAGHYRLTVTASATRYSRSATAKLQVLKAR